jgi:hypothetical protein
MAKDNFKQEMVAEQVELSDMVVDISAEERDNEEGAEQSSMNLTKWLACIALGLSYTTAIQQQACTASIVKHIDIALGKFL